MVAGDVLEVADAFTYLGSQTISSGRITLRVESLSSQPALSSWIRAFDALYIIELNTKLQLYELHVLPVLLYSYET